MAAALASTISHHRLSVNSLLQSPSCRLGAFTRSRNLHCPVSFDFVPKSTPQKNTNTSLETSAQKTQKPSLPGKPVGSPDPDPPPGSSQSNPFSVLIRQIRDGFKVDELGVEILSIALPAALALAADPLTSLVDTAYVGHLGSVELAAVGISVSVFNLVSKLFNVPLLNITTSFVAEEQALVSEGGDGYISDDMRNGPQGKKLLPSVSTSLALAAGIGIAEAVALSFGSGFLMNIMGIPVDSPMRIPAEQFLTMRAFGAPPIVIALAAQGTFRGFFDTKTPLYAIGIGNLLNAILGPILIFSLGLGIGGAAVATVITEYLIAFILLWKLNEKVLLISPSIDGRRVARYLRSVKEFAGGLLIGRTISVLVTMTLATSMAARGGPTQMAGHQICIQVWLAVSLLTDALALAGQALLASGYSQGNYNQAREVIFRTLQIGLAAGIALAVILFLGYGTFSRLFSTDSEVLEIVWSGIWFVAGSQPMNALAFVLDGLYYGVSDFGYAAYSMVPSCSYHNGFQLCDVCFLYQLLHYYVGVCWNDFFGLSAFGFPRTWSCWSLDWAISLHDLACCSWGLEALHENGTMGKGLAQD
ncbi:protein DETOXIFICATION 44, chloroplastic isoform X2 [Tripterygium wilfordii]|uniref:protein DETOXIFICATION 44, chloroplastic isoform X2 n=1 Tax=Tripterygium wilfordii TaxID=458696 RepID=UPI0018F826E5|nr:protein DETOXIFICATION 44, chloroplastic isoform X2 [Tripterygium wilfordii]